MSMTQANQHEYANVGRRFIALLIDLVIFCILFFPVTRIAKGVWIMTREDHLWGYGWIITDPLCMIFLGIIVVYFVVLEGIFGATIGKKLVGLQVIRVDGGKPGIAHSLIRNLLRVIDSLPALNILGVILILKSPERARFGDRIAGTRVIIRRMA